MADGFETTYSPSVVSEVHTARIAFWRSYAAGLALYALAISVGVTLPYVDAARVAASTLAFALFWCILAAIAPRVASFLMLVVCVLGLLNVIVASFVLYRDQGSLVMIVSAIVAIPSGVFAVAFAWATRPHARTFVRARKRLRHQRREARIRAGGGM